MTTEIKFNEWVTISSIIDVQITTIDETIKTSENDDEIKMMKSELSKLKPIRTKLKKLITEY